MSNPYMQEAQEIRKAIDTFAENQTDETLIDNKAAFMPWRAGLQVTTGQILRYGDDIYRVIQSHTTQTDWTPDKTPALFAKISLEEFPQWVQPTGAHDAYKLGAKCSHKGKHWISTIDANVYEPSVYGWNEITE